MMIGAAGGRIDPHQAKLREQIEQRFLHARLFGMLGRQQIDHAAAFLLLAALQPIGQLGEQIASGRAAFGFRDFLGLAEIADGFVGIERHAGQNVKDFRLVDVLVSESRLGRETISRPMRRSSRGEEVTTARR